MVTEKKRTRKRIVPNVPAKAFGDWFRCPRCSGRSIVFNKRNGTYSCRRCGDEFVVDWDHKVCQELPSEEVIT